MQANRRICIFVFFSIFKLCTGQYEYSDLTSNHRLKWIGKCTSVPAGLNYNYRKGKSYEINHESYLTFQTCKSRYSCDKIVERAVRLDDYFRATSGCVQNYCSQCDGSDCSSNCEYYQAMAAATIEDGNSTYNGCSATTSSEGLHYFYGPQCTEDGDLTMGYYFDKYCQLNATRRGNIYSPDSFVSFDVFHFVQSICSDCSYYGVCEDIYTLSFSCRSNYGTLLSIGDDISIVEEDDADGVERRVEQDYYEYYYEGEDNAAEDDFYYEEEVHDEKADGAKEDKSRSTTLSFAEEVCVKINYLEHLQEELFRNTTANYFKAGEIVLTDLSKIICGIGAVLGVGFIFVAHTYHARHKARWAEGKRGALNDEWHDAKSFDEISVASTDAGFSAVNECIPSTMVKS